MTRARGDARPLLTVAAAAATVLTALSCAPLLADLGWWWPSVGLVVLVAGTGALARLAGVPWFVTPFAQLAVVAVCVTFGFARDDAPLGLVPSPGALDALQVLAQSGFDDIDRMATPVASTDGITLVAVVGIALVAVLVDTVAVGLRRPAPAGLALLAVYVVPVAVLPDGLGWGWFVVAALGWLALLAAAQDDAVRRWGRAAGRGGAASRAVTGALAVVLAALVAAALVPGVGEGAFDGVEDRRGDAAGSGGGDDGTGSGTGGGAFDVTRLDVTLTLAENLRVRSERPVLLYWSASGPRYLRLTTVEPDADGGEWHPARPADDAPPTDDPRAWSEPPRGATVERTTVDPAGVAQYLAFRPVPYGTTSVSGLDGWRWDPRTSTVFGDTARPAFPAAGYSTTSAEVDVSPATLTNRPTLVTAPSDLEVPDGVPPEIASLAREVTAGAASPYEQAVALQRWLRTEFVYDVQAPPGSANSVLASFLEQRRGYCQHFAATFTLMARSLGIPTRTVLGFTPGSPAGDLEDGADTWSYEPPVDGLDGQRPFRVTSDNYHAWPEVSFQGVGWVRFEPTPRADGGVDVPGYSGQPLFPPEQPGATATPRATEPQPSPSESLPRGPVPAPGASDGGSSTSSTGDVVVPVLVVVAAVGLLVAPAVVRVLRRRRRLRVAADATDEAAAVEAAWAELADTARDLGVPWADHDSPRRTSEAFTRDAALDDEGVSAVATLTADVEQVRYAPAPRTSGTAAASLARARASVTAGRSAVERLRATLLPRSLRPRRKTSGRTGG